MKKAEIVIIGRVPNNLLYRWEIIRGKKIADNSLVFFCDYSESDIASGKRFKSLKKNNFIIFSGDMVLKSITQEFFQPFDSIPKGWKTICEIEFNELPEHLLNTIPIIKDWFDKNQEKIKLL